MNFTLKPSLKHRALVKIAIGLWNQRLVSNQVAIFFYESLGIIDSLQGWLGIETIVKGNVQKLSLPELLKKEILDFIKPIGLEILKWMKYQYDNSLIYIFYPEKLCWTPQGTVDTKRTAEILIKNENDYTTVERYRLACVYCLEDDARELWNSMSQRQKKFFYGEGHPNFNKEHVLAKFWTYVIDRKQAKLNGLIKEVKGKEISTYSFAFQYAEADSNKAATEYFLKKLTPGDREKYLVRCAGYAAKRRCARIHNSTKIPKEHGADVMCFLLSQMNEEEQVKVFEIYPGRVLRCLLDWPWQSVFMETANRMWAFLPEGGFNYLLREIIYKARRGYKDCNYQNLFREFWQESPNTYKKYVTVRCASNGFLLSDLLKIEDKENIRLIIKNATVQEREELIFNDAGKNICDSLIDSGKWDLLKFFIQECISSEDKMIKFKEEFENPTICNRLTARLEREKDMKDKFFQLLDDLIQKDDQKRGIEEGNSSPAKRLCSLTCGQINSS